MFKIGEATIEDSIAHERFACDLVRCRGACCTPGRRGAPLEDAELAEITRAYQAAQRFLSQNHRHFIEQFGLFEGVKGNFATTCIDERDCVFVFYEDGVAWCALERAYVTGETQWRKPISCHLFPIRVSSQPTARLRYEKISECHPAIARGQDNNVPLYEFLHEPLVRKFGDAWYVEFLEECRRRQT